jgi:hypothetical protein
VLLLALLLGVAAAAAGAQCCVLVAVLLECDHCCCYSYSTAHVAAVGLQGLSVIYCCSVSNSGSSGVISTHYKLVCSTSVAAAAAALAAIVCVSHWAASRLGIIRI